MAVTFKDIDLLSQKASVAGTEKIEVSDTEYITPVQIVDGVQDDVDFIYEKVDLSGLTRYKNQIYSTTNVWVTYNATDPDAIIMLPVNEGEMYLVVAQDGTNARIAVLDESKPHAGQQAQYSTGYDGLITINAGDYLGVSIPNGALSIYIREYTHAGSYELPYVYKLNAMGEYLKESSGSSGVSDVTLGGTSVVSSGVAALPAYPTTLPASDVSSWAKQSTKPTYTASEVGALPASTSIPANTSDLNNDSGFKKITISSSEPTSSDGSNGDIWIVI